VDEIAERIRKCREKKAWTQGELAQALGVSKVAVSNWETGKSKPWENLKALSRTFDVSIDYLVTGEFYKANPRQDLSERILTLKHTTIVSVDTHELKVVEGRAAADFHPAFSKSKETVSVDKRFSGDKHYGIVVHGNSMSNTICEGDTAIIRREGWVLEEFDPERGAALKHEWKRLDKKIVLAKLNGEEPLCKRIRIHDLPSGTTGFFIQLCSDNCESPPIPIWRTDKLEVLGIVVALVRTFAR
jgi:transcriptional regulator with XRE-family HTH domain